MIAAFSYLIATSSPSSLLLAGFVAGALVTQAVGVCVDLWASRKVSA